MAFIVLPGADASGNGNDWTPNNINNTDSTATTYDIMTDVPTLTDADTANFATLNPLDQGSGTSQFIKEGNLLLETGSTGYSGTRCTMATPTSGKWYWEVTQNVITGGMIIGIASATADRPVVPGESATSYGYQNDGAKRNNSASSAYGASYTTNDVIGVALDLDAGTLVFYKNNTSQGTAFSSLSGSFMPMLSDLSNSLSSSAYINFGQRPFAYTPPAGYLKLNTFNLPDSSIVDGSEYFDTVTYAGNSGTNTITELDFQPDFTWIKSTSNSASHSLIDSVRGYYNLRSNSTIAEFSNSGFWDGFNSNGFNLIGPEADANTTGYSYVAWNWKAGGTAVSNTDGTITSTVSANPTAGFSVVTYTGTGSAATVGHGLGVEPNMLIFKNRDDTKNWMVYNKDNGNNNALFLNLTNANSTSNTFINSTTPSSTVFNLATVTNNNGSGNGIVAYCFAEVEGYSKFGKYTGNGSADGPFVYTGFKPAFLMFKTTTIIGHWVIVDTERSTYNVIDDSLYPDTTGSEINTITDVDFLSNGFKWRGVLANETNVNGQVYIYMAFAENPFKNSLAR